MNRLKFIAICSALAVGTAWTGSAAAEGVSGDPPAETVAGGADPDEIICRRDPPPPGSRIGARKTCMSRKDWERREEVAQENAKELLNRGRICAPDQRDGGNLCGV